MLNAEQLASWKYLKAIGKRVLPNPNDYKRGNGLVKRATEALDTRFESLSTKQRVDILNATKRGPKKDVSQYKIKTLRSARFRQRAENAFETLQRPLRKPKTVVREIIAHRPDNGVGFFLHVRHGPLHTDVETALGIAETLIGEYRGYKGINYNRVQIILVCTVKISNKVVTNFAISGSMGTIENAVELYRPSLERIAALEIKFVTQVGLFFRLII